MKYPETPDLDKLVEIAKTQHSNTIGAFLEWLNDKDYQIVKLIWDDELPTVETFEYTIEEWLAKYFDVDLEKANEQRELVYKYVSEQQSKKEPA